MHVLYLLEVKSVF